VFILEFSMELIGKKNVAAKNLIVFIKILNFMCIISMDKV